MKKFSTSVLFVFLATLMVNAQDLQLPKDSVSADIFFESIIITTPIKKENKNETITIQDAYTIINSRNTKNSVKAKKKK